MKKQLTFSHSIAIVAIATMFLLLVPFVAMRFTNEVNWSLSDFIVMGALLFSIGFAYVLATRFVSNTMYKIAIGFALGTTLLMIWANLAVGLIGSGPNPGNLMYIGVVAVGIIGALRSRFAPAGMERIMYAMTVALVLLAIIGLVTQMHQSAGSSITEIVAVNGFFATLFAIAGLLFRYGTQKQSHALKNQRINNAGD